MDGTTISDDSSAIAAGENGSDHQTSVELPDTSTLTRRLARGEYTESIARKITEQKDAARSFKPLGDVSSTREEGSGEDDAVTSATNRPTLQQSKSSGSSNSSNSNNKTALDAVSEYISYYFKNAENYEEMLEKSESQRDLTASLDRRRHGSSRFASPEGGDVDDDADDDNLYHSEEDDDDNETFFSVNPFCGYRVRQSGTMANDLYVKSRWIFGGRFVERQSQNFKRYCVPQLIIKCLFTIVL